MSRTIGIITIGVTVFFTLSNIAAQTKQPAGVAPSVEEVVARTAQQVPNYLSTFRNLVSQETKTFTVFKRSGEPKKTKSVVSTFIVYQSSKNENLVAEYRNVVSVDSKPVGNPEGRAKDFFERLLRSDSSQAELRKVEDESTRYDEISLNGLTLFEGVPLVDNLRPNFSFRQVGRDKVDGFDSYVLEYQQTRESPYISIDEKKQNDDRNFSLVYPVDIGGKGPANERVRGKLWIDANTFQIRRELREMTVQPEGFSRPAVGVSNEFEYQNSEFGILTPKRITYTTYRIDPKSGTSIPEDRAVLEYEKFTRPDVEVKSSEVKH